MSSSVIRVLVKIRISVSRTSNIQPLNLEKRGPVSTLYSLFYRRVIFKISFFFKVPKPLLNVEDLISENIKPEKNSLRAT